MSRASRYRYKEALRNTFGVTAFRPGQKRVVTALLSGRDVLGIFPTGAGKSLCFQLPAVLFSGMTLVISPLISLMRDQVQGLQARGIAAAALDSLQDAAEREATAQAIRSGGVRILYVSPERLQSDSFLRLIGKKRISMVVIDEAHCVVQWGSEFRPSYTEIGSFISGLPERPTVCAMTATADRKMQRQIICSLDMHAPRRVTVSLERENLHYRLVTTIRPGQEIERIIARHQGEKGLIFCHSRAQAERIAATLSGKGIGTAYYHAGMDREQRMLQQKRFRDGEVKVLTATSAFGMGVDIPDIRYLIHRSVPEDMTDYAQQTGRAGRDGGISECVVLMDPADLHREHLALMGERKQVKLHPARYIRWRQACRKREQVLEVLLNGRCIASGITACFGERTRPCGRCSACLRRAEKRGTGRIAEKPPLRHSKAWAIPEWALNWECSMMKDGKQAVPDRVTLRKAARTGYLPTGIPISPSRRDKLQELLDHMR